MKPDLTLLKALSRQVCQRFIFAHLQAGESQTHQNALESFPCVSYFIIL